MADDVTHPGACGSCHRHAGRNNIASFVCPSSVAALVLACRICVNIFRIDLSSLVRKLSTRMYILYTLKSCPVSLLPGPGMPQGVESWAVRASLEGRASCKGFGFSLRCVAGMKALDCAAFLLVSGCWQVDLTCNG